MSNQTRRVPTRFRKETRFEVPIATVPVRGGMERDLDAMKDRLTQELLRQTVDPRFHPAIKQAVRDAATLAWLTPVPLLVLPVLAEEKARESTVQVERQYQIREQTQGIMGLAA
ncbi:MAG TPA: hypothetical protein P5186_05155 [Candidatus Paceibacterota bacterium]|nr:hypothetical protein [Verrucomicrobiota bacterium]HRY47416.1 hypothetical protein [Candidatus Paceibacterota bacterium]HSA00475.1 hypothetical protein [Candidatus Paceibacterota bacterium]